MLEKSNLVCNIVYNQAHPVITRYNFAAFSSSSCVSTKDCVF